MVLNTAHNLVWNFDRMSGPFKQYGLRWWMIDLPGALTGL
jgi:hypothetical protein